MQATHPADPSHKPFLVQIGLRSPVLMGPEGFLTLDAILAAALYQIHQDVERAHSEIPLAQTAGIWHGSAMFHLGDTAPISHVVIAGLNPVRPMDYPMERLTGVPASLNSKEAPFAATQDTYFGAWSRRIVFFGCGDRKRVKTLLELLPGIGKKVGQGFGQIDSIRIHSTASDLSLAFPDGTPTRPIPSRIWQGAGLADVNEDMATWHPPYWRQSNANLCQVPTRQILSKAELEIMEEAEMPPLALPSLTLDHEHIDGMDFFFQHAGERFSMAKQNLPPPEPSQKCAVCGSTETPRRGGLSAKYHYCPRCITLCGSYVGIPTPGRFSDSAQMLVTRQGVLLAAPVKSQEENPFRDLPLIRVFARHEAKKTGSLAADVDAFTHEILSNLPEPPFLWFRGARNNVKAAKNLIVSYRLEKTRLCGKDTTRVNLRAVSDAYLTCLATLTPGERGKLASENLAKLNAHSAHIVAPVAHLTSPELDLVKSALRHSSPADKGAKP